MDLVAAAKLPSDTLAFDVGTGTGVLAAVLARRGVRRVVATDNEPRAIACADENFRNLGVQDRAEAVLTDMFPQQDAVPLPERTPRPPGAGR